MLLNAYLCLHRLCTKSRSPAQKVLILHKKSVADRPEARCSGGLEFLHFCRAAGLFAGGKTQTDIENPRHGKIGFRRGGLHHVHIEPYQHAEGIDKARLVPTPVGFTSAKPTDDNKHRQSPTRNQIKPLPFLLIVFRQTRRQGLSA